MRGKGRWAAGRLHELGAGEHYARLGRRLAFALGPSQAAAHEGASGRMSDQAFATSRPPSQMNNKEMFLAYYFSEAILLNYVKFNA
jgi:hypothetical protein